MAETVTLGGVNYTIPDSGDQPNWATGLVPYLVAIAANVASSPSFMQFVNVAATPTSMTSGKSYLVTTASIAITLNLPAPAQNAWFIVKDVSASAATHNITIHRSGSEQIDGVAADKVLSRNAGTWIIMGDGTNWWTLNEFPDTGLLNTDIASAAAIAYSKLNLTTSIVNGDVATSAAIALSKLAALTTGRSLQSNASTGLIEVSSVTTTELGFVSGVTSALQTQINTKYATSGGQLTGNVSFDNNATHGIVGTTTNNNAASGNVGEYIEALSSADVNAAATGVWDDIVSISLTAGDWQIVGMMAWNSNSSTWAQCRIGISSTSGNSATGLTDGQNMGINGFASSSTTPTAQPLTLSAYRVSLSGTTTYYLKRQAVFSVGTPITRGARLSAWRTR